METITGGITMNDDLEQQRLLYAKTEGLCPECCTTLDYIGEFGFTECANPIWRCTKCGWSVSADILASVEE
jgi:hypothetical protein